MAQVSQTLVLTDEHTLGERIRLARIAAKLEPDDVAQRLGISRRSLDRTEAGSRRPSRSELIVFAALVEQDVSLFGVTSEPQERGTLPLPLPGVNLEADEAA